MIRTGYRFGAIDRVLRVVGAALGLGEPLSRHKRLIEDFYFVLDPDGNELERVSMEEALENARSMWQAAP